MAGLEDALSAVPDRAAIPTGEVTITTTPDIGRELLAPALVPFRSRYPAIRVHVVLTDQVIDLLRDGIDIALRVGRPRGDTLIARKIGDLAAGFFASPAYLSRRGQPARLEELAAHDGLWPSPKGRGAFTTGRTPPLPAIECDDFGLLAEVARAGGGIALLPTFVATRDVASGALIRVLPEVSFKDAPLYLVSRQERPLPSRVAALRGSLLDTLTSR